MIAILVKKIVLVSLLIFPIPFIKAQTENSPIASLQKHSSTEMASHSSNISQELNLKPTNKKIKHVFHITMSKKDFAKLSKTLNVEKNCLSDCIITYDQDTLNLKELELRGKSSLTYKRKSFSVQLNDKIAAVKNGVTHTFKKFNLISLSMDQNYFRNKVAFDLMSRLGLFNLYYSFSEVIINGKSQGIYLMVQKPKNYAFKNENANFMLRRNYGHEIKKTYCRGNDTTLKPKYEEAFLSIYTKIMEKDGRAFYEELSKILDIEQYYTWMAFNFLIGNKDYTDEVFFFNKASGEDIKFGIIPWDYDDIFFDNPHEGWLIRRLSFADKLAFSSEDALDYKLINDGYSYTKYLQTLANVIDRISDSVLKEVFELNYQELYPYYSKKDILKVSRLDKYGKTDLTKLALDMQTIYQWLMQKREATIKLLKE